MAKPLVAIVMGSQSDWPILQHASCILDGLLTPIPHIVEIVSAHRTPKKLETFSKHCEKTGIEIIIAGAGGAAHLPGMLAANTYLPVLGVPMPSEYLKGMDSLLSIVQMPKGVPVGTFAIGKPGALNAALFACAILANKYVQYQEALQDFRQKQTDLIIKNPTPN
ncbi:MAG: 5-(carboxyamino)imidazole ribonucleotide mutase [Thiotrichales bacterium]|nr:MAG: 5-(carboxyamino)imidazole ribonucleotide mutase [Thiotrichales bacterium]